MPIISKAYRRGVIATSMCKIIKCASSVMRRVFIYNDPVLHSHYLLSTPLTFVGDFEFECDTYLNNFSTPYNLCGSTSTFIRLVSANTLLFNYGVGRELNITLSPALTSNEMHSLKVKRVGLSVEVSTSQGTIGNGVCSLSQDFSIDCIGDKEGIHNFDGIVANPKFTDLVNPVNNQTYKLDSATGNIDLAQENVFDSNVAPSYDTLGNWTGVGVSVTMEETGIVDVYQGVTGGFRAELWIRGLSIGKVYEVVFTVHDLDIVKEVPLFNHWTGVVDTPRKIIQKGENTILVAAASTDIRTRIYPGSGGNSVSVVGLSCREASSAISYVNCTEENREVFEHDGVKTWKNISPSPKALPLTIVEV